MKRAAAFHARVDYKGPFIIAVDATALSPSLRSKGNVIYGLATESDFIVSSAQDIIDIAKKRNVEKAGQANAIVLVPIQEHVPSFVLAISPVVNGQSYLTVNDWYTKTMQCCLTSNMKVIGIGADGDSKFRKYFIQRFVNGELQTGGNIITIPYESFEYVSVIEKINDLEIPTLMFPDWQHLRKKWRNQLLNVKRILVIGNQAAQLEHLIKTYKAHKLESGLWKSDIFVKDNQNVKAATRTLGDTVQQCMVSMDAERTIGTRVYLKMGQNMLRAYTKPNISVKECARLAWSAVSFLRLWKTWLIISGFKAETLFISDQTYNDFILTGNSIILSMKIYSIYFPNQPYHPWMFGSNACEEHFTGLSGFCRGKSNLCKLDTIDLCGRIQKLKELKLLGIGLPEAHTPDWNDIDKEITEGMKSAHKEVLKTIELLGMLPNLVKGNIIRNIIRQEGDNLIYLNREMSGKDGAVSPGRDRLLALAIMCGISRALFPYIGISVFTRGKSLQTRKISYGQMDVQFSK